VLTFDRRLVTNIEIVGKGGRPSNDTVAKAEPVTLDTGPSGVDELGARELYQQSYDLAEAGPNELSCRAAQLHGVWLRLDAHQAGRIEPIGIPPPLPGQPVTQQLTFILVDVDDNTVCGTVTASALGADPSAWGVRMDANTSVLLFVGMENVGHERTRPRIGLRYSPLAADATDCRLAYGLNAAKAIQCPSETQGGLGMRVRVPARAGLTALVDVANAGFAARADGTCPPDAGLPTLTAAGKSLRASGCVQSPREAESVTVTFTGFTQGTADGNVDLLACPPSADDGQILGLRATLSPPAIRRGPAPPPESPALEPAQPRTPAETTGVPVACPT